jgi:uncharacterized membrane protein (UPF0182 family)
MNTRSPLLWLAMVLAALFFGGQTLAFLVTDWLWFDAIGHGDVFVRVLGAQAACGLAVGLLFGLSVFVSGRRALAHTRNRPVVLSQEMRGTPVAVWLQQPTTLDDAIRAAGMAAFVLGALIGAGNWQVVVSWWHAVPFGYTDPILGNDASTYVFTLPFLRMLRALGLFAVVAAFGTAVFVYVTRGAFTVIVPAQEGESPSLKADPGPRRHLASLVTAWVLLVAVGYHLQRYLVMSDLQGRFDGPGYTDVTTVLPLLGIQALATAVAGFLLFQAIDQARSGWAVWAVFVVMGSSLASSVVPGAVQRFLVEPNELERERVYLAEHVHATRRAWGLDDVEERTLTGDAQLSLDDVDANEATLKNVRLWDHKPLLQTFRQLQEIRTYYRFGSVDNDRYVIDGELRQTMLSPRELVPDQLDPQARTWVNETLVYTHGYGVALGPVNEVTPEGLPLLWVKDLPPAVSHEDPLGIDNAALYYGEFMPDGVFVRTNAQEFDHPTADGNAYATYDGAGGLPVANLFRRAMLALRMGSWEILLSDDLTDASRALLYRGVTNRVAQVAPFLAVDTDPYLVIADGRLVWIVEGYTTTNDYPYAEHRDFSTRRRSQVNYVRNSVKATVDAYDGTTILYAMDAEDPLLQAWSAAFPSLLQPADAMPQAIRDHIRVPMQLFGHLTELFAIYHMTDSQDFYNREDAWEIPTWADAGSKVRMEPYYTVMKLPGEDSEEFIVMLPFVPREKQNLAAWMVARTDGDAYGSMRVYRFPKDRLVYGPGQIAQRITQDAEISQRLTLWGQQKSEVQLGTLLVIPIEESLLYVQPLYLQAGGDPIPELKRVIVAYENQITMAPTLDEAVRELFGGAAPEVAEVVPAAMERLPGLPDMPMPGDWQGLSQRAASQYDAALEASRTGQWTAFGQALDALGLTLGELRDLAGPDPVEEPAPPEDAVPQE